jgi:hypothetical protein
MPCESAGVSINLHPIVKEWPLASSSWQLAIKTIGKDALIL